MTDLTEAIAQCLARGYGIQLSQNENLVFEAEILLF